jgi:hypothetical protein
MWGDMARARKRSLEELEGIMKRYKASGLSQNRFCREQGLAESSFIGWKRRLGMRVKAAGKFVRLGPAEPLAVPLQPGVEVKFPSGIVLKIQG